jgi:hypothetical protein
VSVRVGRYTFRYVTYDASSDVLDAAIDGPRPGRREPTPEEHVWRFDDRDRFFGLSLRNVRNQLEREGGVFVTLPSGERERVAGAESIIRRG